jgi:hypothetical protein
MLVKVLVVLAVCVIPAREYGVGRNTGGENPQKTEYREHVLAPCASATQR